MVEPFKHVLFVINALRVGGAERVCVSLANGLASKGWGVDVVVLNSCDALLESELDSAIRIHSLGIKNARKSIFRLYNAIKEISPDQILVFNHQLAVVLVILRKYGNLKHKLIARNINTLSAKKAGERSYWHKYIVHFLTRLFYRWVDQIVAQSYGMKDDLVCNYGIAENKIVVINNPISRQYLTVKLNAAESTAEYLLCVGKLESQKNFHDAIKMIEHILPKYPNIKLKIAGRGSLKSDLLNYAKKLEVSGHVELCGQVNDLKPYYLNAKATVLTSLYEGFPNVLLESLACGTPVVAYDCPSGPSEIIKNGINGFLVSSGNMEQLCGAVNKVLAKQWDQSSVVETTQDYLPEKILAKYEKVLLC